MQVIGFTGTPAGAGKAAPRKGVDRRLDWGNGHETVRFVCFQRLDGFVWYSLAGGLALGRLM